MQQQRRRRSRLILGFLSLGLLVGVALTAHPAQAVDAVGPYLAVPSWDRQIAPANRFVVLTNWFSQAVLDKETGLVWEKAVASDLRVWGAGPDNARLQCANVTTGGRKGWRLPSVAELASLIDPARTFPALPLGHPFTLNPSVRYWSATTDAENSSKAWNVWFDTGNVEPDLKTFTFRVWCVRGPMQESVY